MGTRTKYVLLAVFFVAFYLLGFGYHLYTFLSSEPPGFALALLYNVVILAGYGVLWMLLSRVFRERQATPARIFWTTVVFGAFFSAAAVGISYLGRADIVTDTAGFDYETQVPLTLATVVKMNLLSLLEATFFIILLLRFRDLVLFKRTKASQRNWYVMLGLMIMTAMTKFMSPTGGGLGLLTVLPMVPAVAFMVVNSLRLSWIVHLTFREKIAIIGLTVLLLLILTVYLPFSSFSALHPEDSGYLTNYSFPLSFFLLLTVIFGVLYCTTALLSLIFHLPTTSDFQRKADEMAVMHSLTHLVNQVFDPNKLVTTITASPVEAGSADAAWLASPDPGSGSLRPRIRATHNIAPALVAELVDTHAFYEEVMATHEPLLIDQAVADHRVEARLGDGLGSLLVMPLIARDEVLGALFVAREVTHGFEKDDVEAIGVFAAQAALALDNARLFEEQIEKERLARELAIAREVQHKLLPQRLPPFDGITLAASSVSAHEVGGDYYDFAVLDAHHLAFIIADVSGKGTSAAFYMAELQGIFHALSKLTPEPLDFLTHANRALSSSLERNIFVSVIYGLLDLENEEVRIARAGHCPAATINLHGEARFLRSQGLGLGLDRGPLFRKTLAVEQIDLQPGDVLVLYTDGVVESRNAESEEYGYERLLAALREHRHEDAAALHASLLEDLHTFIGAQDLYDDDLTLVVLKWHGLGVAPPATFAEDGHREKDAPRPVSLD